MSNYIEFDTFNLVLVVKAILDFIQKCPNKDFVSRYSKVRLYNPNSDGSITFDFGMPRKEN